MTSHITFKEYLASKERLYEAIKQTPVRVVEYNVQTYCKLPVGPNKEEKEYLSLKPKQVLIVEWLYTDFNNPSPTHVMLKDSTHTSSTYWSGKKLEKWLMKNTKERV
jgi:hypothetical protein